MQTDSRTRPVLDLADMMSGLPPAVAGNLTGLPGAAPRQNRRLPERILVAAHQACDLGDLDVAAQLLSILETVIGQSRGGQGRGGQGVGSADPGRRRVMESLIAAHQRLWHLRHADEVAGGVVGSTGGVAPRSVPSLREEPVFQEEQGFHEPFDMTDFQPSA